MPYDFEVEDGLTFGDWLHREIHAVAVVESHGWAAEQLHRVAERLQANRPRSERQVVEVLWLRQANAFAVPGRYLCVSRRLLERCREDEMVAFVIAHEIAHHDLGHQSLISGWAGKVSRITGTRLKALPFQALKSRLYGPERECAADRHGLGLCMAAGYDPLRCLHVFDVFEHLALDAKDFDMVYGLDPNSDEDLSPGARCTQGLTRLIIHLQRRAIMQLARLLFSVCALVLIAVPGRAQDTSPTGLADAFARAQKPFAASDWVGVRAALTAAESFAPNHPVVLYHLARAEALTGNVDGALRRLQRLEKSGGTERDLAADSAFALLRGRADFQAVQQRLRAAAAPVVRGDTAFVLADPDFIPEGIAYDARNDAFFVGSLHRGQILRVTRGGTARIFSVNAAGATQGRRGQVLGLRVDPARRVLWAATLVIDTAAPRFRRGPGGWAALRAFDLPTGRMVASYTPPDSTAPHLLNDIALAPNGDVYVTDSEGDALFRLAKGKKKLETVYGGSSRFVYPNGVAIDAKRGRIYVAHMEGISTFRLAGTLPAKEAPVVRPTGGPTSGMDGLYACGGTLLGIQSLLDAQQVTRLGLDTDGATVTSTTVLERKHPAHDIPTTGVIAGDNLFYIAGSQLGRLQPDGSVRAADRTPKASVVLKLPLNGVCKGGQ